MNGANEYRGVHKAAIVREYPACPLQIYSSKSSPLIAYAKSVCVKCDRVTTLQFASNGREPSLARAILQVSWVGGEGGREGGPKLETATPSAGC